MDIACSTRNVPLLRRLEQCAPYAGWLLVKVPQFGGLGSSWQRRWVVVSHRYPNPQARAPWGWEASCAAEGCGSA